MTRSKDDYGFRILTKITSVFFNCFDAYMDLKDIPLQLAEEFYNTLYPDVLILTEKDMVINKSVEIFKKFREGFAKEDLNNAIFVQIPLFKTPDSKDYIFLFFYKQYEPYHNIIDLLQNEDFKKWIHNISQSLYSLLAFFKEMESIRIFFQSIIHTLPDILVVFDKNNNIQEWQDNTNITGYNSKTMRGKKISSFFELLNIEDIKEELRSEKAKEVLIPTIRGVEAFFITAGQLKKEVEFDFSYFVDEKTEQEFFVGIGKDISLNKKLQRLLHKKNVETQEKNKKLQEYLDHYTKELKFAAILQNRMIKNEEKTVAGLRYTKLYKPFQYVGGDYIGVLPMQDRLYFTIADVVGHGIFSAFYSAMYHSSFYNLVFYPESIEEIIKRIYQEFTTVMEDDNFITLIIGTIYPEQKKIEWINYGHPAPIFYDAQKKEARLFQKNNNPIVSPLIPLTQPKKIELFYQSGDKFLIFSDGLIEQNQEEEKKFQSLEKNFQESLHTLSGMALAENLIEKQCLTIKAIDSSASTKSNENLFDDDISLILFEF